MRSFHFQNNYINYPSSNRKYLSEATSTEQQHAVPNNNVVTTSQTSLEPNVFRLM